MWEISYYKNIIYYDSEQGTFTRSFTSTATGNTRVEAAYAAWLATAIPEEAFIAEWEIKNYPLKIVQFAVTANKRGALVA